MTRVRKQGETVRRFIVENVEKHPMDIARVVAGQFHISRQAANKHLQHLIAEDALKVAGKTRNRKYSLAPQIEFQDTYKIELGLAEDVVWRNDISRVLEHLPENAQNIWHHGFTEMFNNAIDHSGGTEIHVRIEKTAASTKMFIFDNGVGIFKKIQKALNLLDERHAILELAKGKLTTDPKRHSGEGIFFTSRVFDEFSIYSGGVFFAHKHGNPEDWILQKEDESGTIVRMVLHNHTSRTLKRIFDQYSSGDDYRFNKTVVPVVLAQYGNESLISRSQAKRVLARVELFKCVVFDFANVELIGQAFADEVFRVFANTHPDIELIVIKANSAIKRMIERAKVGVIGLRDVT